MGESGSAILGLLERYQAAMLAFDADALADLYAPTAVHEYGFFVPGVSAPYNGADEVREAYRKLWATPRVALTSIENLATYLPDTHSVIAEWNCEGSTIGDARPIRLAGVLFMREQGDELVHVRDYMDVLGLAHQTGSLLSLAQQLAATRN